MNTATAPYYTKVNLQLVTTKSIATDTKLLDLISDEVIVHNQQYETDSKPILENSLSQSENIQTRLQCHNLIEQIPAEGLPELIERIEETYKFYVERSQYDLSQLPKPIEKPMKSMGVHEVPPFAVDEDEE